MAEQAEKAIAFVRYYALNFWHNATHMFDGMDVIRYVRLIAIVGAYILFRPYLEKLAAKFQEKQFEKMDKDTKEQEEKAAKAKISANSLRGEKPKVVEESEEEVEATTGADWGKNARKRQKQTIRRAQEAEDKRKQEEEDSWSDPDVSDLLT